MRIWDKTTVLLGFIVAACVVAAVWPLKAQGPFSSGHFTLRAASGALTAGETTTPVTGLSGFSVCTVFFDVTTMTTADADDVVDFYFQASFDGGANFCDVEQQHYDIADTGTSPTLIMGFGANDFLATDIGVNCTDATLTDDTKLRSQVGSRYRIKTLVEGATAPTYAYAATIACR